MTASTCAGCDGRMPRPAATGRPRLRCRACAADRAALGRAWRAAHPGRVAAYRVERRRQLLADRAAKAEADARRQVTALRRDAERIRARSTRLSEVTS